MPSDKKPTIVTGSPGVLNTTSIQTFHFSTQYTDTSIPTFHFSTWYTDTSIQTFHFSTQYIDTSIPDDLLKSPINNIINNAFRQKATIITVSLGSP